MQIQERYRPQLLTVNATYTLGGSSLGGFLCVTAGNITVTDLNGLVILNACPVSAGIYLPLPFLLQTIGGTVVLAGGASGTLGVA